MKRTIVSAICAFGTGRPQIGFFDSQQTYDSFRKEAPNSLQGEPQSLTIDDDVTNDITVWDSDDVSQLVQEHNLTENA